MTLRARSLRTAGVATALVLTMTLAACSGDDDSGATTDSTTPTTPASTTPASTSPSSGQPSSGQQGGGQQGGGQPSSGKQGTAQYSFTVSKVGLIRAPEFSQMKSKVGQTVEFILKNKSPYDYHLDLIGVDAHTRISGAEGNKGDKITFTVTLKKPGLYRLKFYHDKNKQLNWRPFQVSP